MPPPTPRLRPARPTHEDGLVFAEHLDQAAEGIFALMLGKKAPEIIAEAFTAPSHDLSYEHVTIAEMDTTPVGMASGYTGRAHHAASDEALEAAAGVRRYRMGAVALFASPVLNFMDQIEEDRFYIQAVAIDPAHRGGGIGSLLLDHLQQQGVAAGMTHLALDVSDSNDGARRLYERLGYEVVRTSGRIVGMPRTQVHRMEKPLSASGSGRTPT